MKNERGSTLALCVIIMAMLSVFVCGISGILIASRKAKMKELATEKGFYIVDSCIELTQVDMQTKLASQIAATFGSIGFDEVPVTYHDPETGDVEVYTPEEFKKIYTSYVMQVFCTEEIREGLRYNRAHEDPDDPSTPIVDADILGATLTQNVAQRAPSYLHHEDGTTPSEDEQYSVETEVEQNISYSNFGAAYLNEINDPDYELPDNFNAGYFQLIYTIKYPDGTVEKVRAAYTFDMYAIIKQICDTHSDLIYNKITDPDADPDSSITETTFNLDLNPEVVREYLVD